MKNQAISEKFELLKERLNSEKETSAETYARLLKRRRLELKRTLEDVASGVCSTSYLSRIENAQVEVDDSFLKHLFDKLELSYDNVKLQNKKDILRELIRKYLQDDFETLRIMINEAIELNVYSDVELKLMMLLQNIIDNHFEEARLTIVDLDEIVQTLVGKELIIFTYLSTLFAYKINNLATACKYVRILLAIIYEDDIINQAVNDLAMSIFALIDEDVLFEESYHFLTNSKINKVSQVRMLEHYIEMNSIIAKNDFSRGLDAFTEIKDSIELYPDILEHYQYFFMKIHIINNKLNEAFNIFDQSVKSTRMVVLLNYCLLNSCDFRKAISYLELLRKQQFTKYESFHLFYNEYTIKKFEKNNCLELIDYLRHNLIVSCRELHNSFILQNISFIYIEALFEMGKYKEAAKYALRFLDRNR